MSQQQYLETVASWHKELLEATGNAWQVELVCDQQHCSESVRVAGLRLRERLQ